MKNLYKILNEHHSICLCIIYLVLMVVLTRLFINKKLISRLNQNYPTKTSIKENAIWYLSYLSFIIISISFYSFDNWILKITALFCSIVSFTAATAAVPEKFRTIFLLTLLIIPTLSLFIALDLENLFALFDARTDIFHKITVLSTGLVISCMILTYWLIRVDPLRELSKT
jgi:hypothetical protein